MLANDALQNVIPFGDFAARLGRIIRPNQPITNEWNNSSDASFARIRIKKELDELLSNPIEDISCGPKERDNGTEDLFHWNAVINGPKLTPYTNGIYHIRIAFPKTYPMDGPQIRYAPNLCTCYHKNVDASGYIISMNKLINKNHDPLQNQFQNMGIGINQNENWWNLSMGIRDVLIQIRNMFYDDDLKEILTPPRSHTHHQWRVHGHVRRISTPPRSDLLFAHIVKIGINNQRYCHGKPLPVWLLKQINGNMLQINKVVHQSQITMIKQLFYNNTRLCVGIIDEIIGFYGNQWICGKLWTEYEDYKPLTQFIENECRDKL